jgi:xylulokinase
VPLVAGIDSSTQSTKVELRDLATGEVLGAGRSAHPPTVPPRSEQAPAVWWGAVVEAMAGALGEVSGRAAPSDVVAIAVAGQQHGLVVLDRDRDVLRPAKLWNDTESAPDADGLVDGLGAARWAEACGSVPVAAFTVTKLAWLRRRQPEVFAQIGHVLLPHDWLTFRMTGRFVTDRGDASGTGYWSPSEDRYRLDLLALVDPVTEWADRLPTVLGPWDRAGPLTAAAADRLGLVKGTTVAVGTGDNMAAALGIGLRPGETAISVGTSGTVFTTSDRPTGDPTGAVAGFADATGHFLPLVCTLNATLVTDAVGRLLAVDRPVLDELALRAPTGAGGLVLVPYLAGERTPNRPRATGTLAGIRPDVDRAALARAAFEGVVCGLLDGLDALSAVGVPTDGGRLVLVGGGARSVAYRHVVASLSGRPVTVPDPDEIVSAGAALQAAVAVSGAGVEEITEAWGLRGGSLVGPGPDAEASGEVRRRYADARDGG